MLYNLSVVGCYATLKVIFDKMLTEYLKSNSRRLLPLFFKFEREDIIALLILVAARVLVSSVPVVNTIVFITAMYLLMRRVDILYKIFEGISEPLVAETV